MHAKNGVGLACVLGFVFAGVSFGAMIRYVDVSNAVPAAPYTNWSMAATNIQQAINWANNGDLINVRPGVYRTTNAVEIPSGKTLTLRSTTSRAAVMDAQNRSLALLVLGTNSSVEGFTVRNGSNTLSGYGGGIYLAAPSTVSNCLVVSNRAYGGAGIHVNASGGRILNCTIEKNQAGAIGGGVLFYNQSSGSVANCEIRFNTASNDGAGVYMQYAGTASNCWIADNQAMTGSGGGVDIYHGGKVVNSVVIGNSSTFRGGGIHARYDGGTILHCTVASNTCAGEGGGIWMANTCTTVNSIVYYNVAPASANFYAHNTAVASNNCTTPAVGSGSVTGAPQFTSLSGRTFTLTGTSPCIDAGLAAYGLTTDYAGNPRPSGALPDIGAYEYASGWDAGYTSIGGGWRRLGWFGDYVPMGDWIFHNKHGFWYPAPGSTPQNIWFYTQDMGWLYTSSTLYPYLYRSSPASWLWYNGATNPRWFRNMTTGQWESRP